MQQIIPANLLQELNKLGSAIVSIKENEELAMTQFKRVVEIGRAEGFTDDDIKVMIRQELKNKGIMSDKSFYRYLPDELKAPHRVKNGSQAAKNINKKETAEDEDKIPIRSIGDTFANKADPEAFPYLENKVKVLQAKVNQLQAQPVGRNTCRVSKRQFAALDRLLKMDVEAVDLTFDIQTGEVSGMVQVK